MPAEGDHQPPLDYAAPREPQPDDPSRVQVADVVVMALLGAAGVVSLAAGTLMVLITALAGVGEGAILTLFASGLASSFLHCFVWVLAKPTEVRLPGDKWWHAGVVWFWTMFVVMQVIARLR